MDLVDERVDGSAKTKRAGTLEHCAYASDVECDPTQDPVFMATQVDRSAGDPRTAPERDAWKGGWIRASLAAAAKRRRCRRKR